MKSCTCCSSASEATICQACVERLNDTTYADRKMNRLIWGLKVMRAYGPVSIATNGDALNAGPNGDTIKEEDRVALLGLGWTWDDLYECFRLFI